MFLRRHSASVGHWSRATAGVKTLLRQKRRRVLFCRCLGSGVGESRWQPLFSVVAGGTCTRGSDVSTLPAANNNAVAVGNASCQPPHEHRLQGSDPNGVPAALGGRGKALCRRHRCHKLPLPGRTPSGTLEMCGAAQLPSGSQPTCSPRPLPGAALPCLVEEGMPAARLHAALLATSTRVALAVATRANQMRAGSAGVWASTCCCLAHARGARGGTH